MDRGQAPARHGAAGGGRLDDAAAELEAVSKAADSPPTVWTTLAEVQLLLTVRRPESARVWSRVEQALAKATALDSATRT